MGNNNKDEFFVTVFSNQSINIYPDNTLSKFEAELPAPIHLPSNEKYVAALVDISHSPILGVGLPRDVITFRKGPFFMENTFKYYTEKKAITDLFSKVVDEVKTPQEIPKELLNKLTDFDKKLSKNIIFIPETYFEKIGVTLWGSAKQPFMYDRDYFAPFLQPYNLSTILEEESELSKYETNIDWDAVENGTKSIFLVAPGEILQKFRTEDKKKTEDEKKTEKKKTDYEKLKETPGETIKDKIKASDYFVFEYDREYTCHQVLFVILSKFKDLCEKYKTDKRFLEKYDFPITLTESMSITDVLFFIASHIVNVYEKAYDSHKKIAKSNDSNFILVYADFIAPRAVGNVFSNVLYMTTTRTNEKQGYVEVTHPQYIEVNKSTIKSMAFKLTNEFGEPIFMEGGYNPTSITIHFKRV